MFLFLHTKLLIVLVCCLLWFLFCFTSLVSFSYLGSAVLPGVSCLSWAPCVFTPSVCLNWLLCPPSLYCFLPQCFPGFASIRFPSCCPVTVFLYFLLLHWSWSLSSSFVSWVLHLGPYFKYIQKNKLCRCSHATARSCMCEKEREREKYCYKLVVINGSLNFLQVMNH